MHFRNASLALFTASKLFQHPFSPLPQLGNMTRAPVVLVCHGGGPMPLLGDPDHKELIDTMKNKIPKVLKLGTEEAPRAIVLVTAHWTKANPTISNAERHKLYYDYGGFPPETYKLKYDAPGSPEVAKEVYGVLESAGMGPEMDSIRGWDHGVFVPMLLINPKADIPIVQLSVFNSDSPAKHYAMGRALSSLRDQNIAIIGSGMPTFHNLRLMFSGAASDPSFLKRNREWSERLTATISKKDAEERGKALESWRSWEGADEAHPRGGAEHFAPLVVCAGAAGDGDVVAVGDAMMGVKQFSYYWA